MLDIQDILYQKLPNFHEQIFKCYKVLSTKQPAIVELIFLNSVFENGQQKMHFEGENASNF